MKYSIYNSQIAINDSLILYFNALTRKYLFCPKEDSSRVDIDKISISDLQQKNPELYEQFKEFGFIIPNDLDEKEILCDILKSSRHRDDTFIMHINPTLDCNLRCHYCYEKHKAGTKLDEQTFANIKDLITDIIKSKPQLKDFTLGFFGGEPLMQYEEHMKPLIEFFTKICEDNNIIPKIGITTNSVLMNDDLIALLKGRDCMLQITLDGPKEEHDKVRFEKGGIGTFDRIIDNIKKLCRNHIKTVVRINYTASKLPVLEDIIKYLDIPSDDKKYVTIDFQRVWQDRDKHNLSWDIKYEVKAIKNKFKEAGFIIANHDFHNGVDEPCYGDMKNYMLINYNGDIYHCTARDFDGKYCIGKLRKNGKIVWNDALKDKYERLFGNEYCLTCRIAPFCGGGCSQKHIDNEVQGKCILGFDESELDQVILDRIEQVFIP